MKPYSNTRQIRHTAAVMLFVWLTAWGIGLANACLLTQYQGQHGPSAHGMAALHEDGDEHAPTSEKATCISFCAAEKTTLIKQQLEGSAGMDWLPVLLLSGLIIQLRDQDQGTQQRPHLRPTWPETPVALRFSRLTI